MAKSAFIFFIIIQFKQFLRRKVLNVSAFRITENWSFNFILSFKESLFGLHLTLTSRYMHLRAKLSPTLLFMTFFITPRPSYLQIRSLEFGNWQLTHPDPIFSLSPTLGCLSPFESFPCPLPLYISGHAQTIFKTISSFNIYCF